MLTLKALFIVTSSQRTCFRPPMVSKSWTWDWRFWQATAQDVPWDLRNGQRLTFRDMDTSFLSGGLTLWPDETKLTVVSNTNFATCDLETPSRVAMFDIRPVTLTARQHVQISGNSQFLATKEPDNRLRLRDPNTGQILREFQTNGEGSWRVGLAFSPDSARVAFAP